MLHQSGIRRISILIMFVAVVLFLVSCGPKARVASNDGESHRGTSSRVISSMDKPDGISIST